jgi:predicted Fe-Mo cluster-binding NifX family protein
MKLALPLTATDEFPLRYGDAAKFAVFDIDPTQHVVHRRLIVVPQASEPCEWPTVLRAAGVDLVLAGGMGARARAHMDEHGLKVLDGVLPAAPEAIIEAWMSGRLPTCVSYCDSTVSTETSIQERKTIP